ncbi:MAG: hypothetical protein ACOX8A_03195 [Thermacetogeniaceae bacterium]
MRKGDRCKLEPALLSHPALFVTEIFNERGEIVQGDDFRKRVITGVLIVLVIIGCAYLIEKGFLAIGLKSAKVIRVLDENKPIAYLDSRVLEQIGDQDPKGPPLIAVLNAAGAEEYDEIVIRGLGDGSVYFLHREQLNNKLICSLNGNGTADLIDQRTSQVLVKLIKEIEVK